MRCRSQTIAQGVQASLSEVTSPSQEQQSVPVEAFLRELHLAVDSLQGSRARASEAATRLEQLPGAVLSGSVDHAAVLAEAHWLMAVASSVTLPGTLLFTPVFPVLRTIGCASTTHTKGEHGARHGLPHGLRVMAQGCSAQGAGSSGAGDADQLRLLLQGSAWALPALRWAASCMLRHPRQMRQVAPPGSAWQRAWQPPWAPHKCCQGWTQEAHGCCATLSMSRL